MGHGFTPPKPEYITRAIPPEWVTQISPPFVASCRPPRVPLKPIPDPAPAGKLAAIVAAIRERLTCPHS